MIEINHKIWTNWNADKVLMSSFLDFIMIRQISNEKDIYFYSNLNNYLLVYGIDLTHREISKFKEAILHEIPEGPNLS